MRVVAFQRGWPVSIETAEVIDAPPEVVWELLTDWEHQGDWMLEASDFVVISEHREGVGVEAEATVKIAGISTRDRVRIIGWEPPHRLVIQHLGWVQGTGAIHLTPLPRERTHVFWKEELQPPIGTLGALGMSALKPVMKRIFERDLRVLATLARERARRSGEHPGGNVV